MTWTKLHDLFEGRVTSFTNAEIIKNMREFPQGIYSSDDRGYTPLHIAVTKNDPLIDAIGALPNAYPNAVISKVNILFDTGSIATQIFLMKSMFARIYTVTRPCI